MAQQSDNGAGPPYEAASDYSSSESYTARIRRELQQIYNDCNRAVTDKEGMKKPKNFKTTMKRYQKEALKWLYSREKAEIYGGIYADDMGMGKTATMIALILKTELDDRKNDSDDSDAEVVESSSQATTEASQTETSEPATMEIENRKPQGGTLIVCPLTLVGHWRNQVQTHVKEPHGRYMSIKEHQGNTRTKNPEKLAFDTRVVITTYDVVRAELDKGPLFKVRWGRIILDEAHEIRNPDTKGCNAVTSLEAKHRWCVTGTPVHNSLLDLHGLYKFLKWKPFNNRGDWESWFGDPELNDEMHALWNDIKNASVLRRLKCSDEFPKKQTHLIRIDMDMNERDVYEKVATYPKKYSEQGTLDGEQKTRGMYLFSILALRQAANNPSLLWEDEEVDQELDLDVTVNPDANEGVERDKTRLIEEWRGLKKDLQQHIALDKQADIFKIDRPSSKMEKLLEKLKVVLAKGDKAVIVSLWVKMLDRIRLFLNTNLISCEVLQGSMNQEERTRVVDSFNKPSSGSQVLLLSLKAGGAGLNLVGANHLFLFDVHWNPQLENQACDRIHRLGQKKDVFIYKFVVNGTIEEEIYESQKAKLDLAGTVLDNPNTRRTRIKTSLGENDEISAMLRKEAERSKKRNAPQQPTHDYNKRACPS